MDSSGYGIVPITFIFVKVVKINYRELSKTTSRSLDYRDFWIFFRNLL